MKNCYGGNAYAASPVDQNMENNFWAFHDFMVGVFLHFYIIFAN